MLRTAGPRSPRFTMTSLDALAPPEAEGAAGQRADDAVRHQVVAALEALHSALSLLSEDAVRADPELLLDPPNGRATVATLHDHLGGGAGATGGRGAGVRERGHGRNDHCGQREQAREMRATHGVENPCHLTVPLSSAYGVS